MSWGPGIIRAGLAACLLGLTAPPSVRPELPETQSRFGATEQQRMRFRNASLLRKGHEALAHGRLHDAEYYFRRVLENDPLHNQARLCLIDTYDRLGRWREALGLCERLAHDYPDVLDLQFTRGYLALRLRRYEVAAEAFESVRQRAPAGYPRLEEALENLAQTYYHAGEVAVAALIEEDLLRARDTLERRVFLAECSVRQTNWVTAIEHLSRATERAETPGERGVLHLKLANALYRAGRADEADRALRAAARLVPDATRQRELLEEAGGAPGHYQRAAERFRVQLDERFDEDVATSYLSALHASGQWRAGLVAASRILERSGLSRELREYALNHQLAFFKYLHDDGNCARTARRLSEEFGGTRYRFEMAMAADRLGRLDEALGSYRAALAAEFDPGVAMSYHYALKRRAAEVEERQGPEAAAPLREASEVVLERVQRIAAAPPALRDAATYELAQLYRQLDREAAYFRTMQDFLRTRSEPAFLREYAVQLQAAQRYDEALAILLRCQAMFAEREEQAANARSIAEVLLLKDDAAGAADWLEKSAALRAPDRAWQLARARADYALGRHPACVDRLLPLADDDGLVHMQMAFCFSRMGMPGLALHHFNRVRDVEALPMEQQFTYYANRAYLHFDQGLYAATLDDVHAALSLKSSADLESVRMRALVETGAYDAALRLGLDLLQAAEAEGAPADPELLRLIGLCHFRLGHDAEARSFFTRVIEGGPAETGAEVYYLRGLANLRTGKLPEAEDDLLVIYDHADTFPPTFWSDLGVLEGQLGDYELGARALSNSLDHFRCDLDALNERAAQLAKAGRKAEAGEAFARALDVYAAVTPCLEGDEAARCRAAIEKLRRKQRIAEKPVGLGVVPPEAAAGDATNAPPERARAEPRGPLHGTFVQLNRAAAGRSAREWAESFERMKELGIATVIVQWTAEEPVLYFRTPAASGTSFVESFEAVEQILQAAQDTGVSVHLGLQHDPRYWSEAAGRESSLRTYLLVRVAQNEALQKALQHRFGRHPQWRGYFIAEELDDLTWRRPERRALMKEYVRRMAGRLKANDPGRAVSISAFFRARSLPDVFAEVARDLVRDAAVDHLLVQDGAGEDGVPEAYVPAYFESLRASWTSPSPDLWCVVEAFRRTSPEGRPFEAVSAEPARVARQIAAARRYFNRLVLFTFHDYADPASAGDAHALFRALREPPP